MTELTTVDDLTLLESYPDYIQQLIERLRITRQESIHYNATVAEQKYAEVRNLLKELEVKTKNCEAIKQKLSELQADESDIQQELRARKLGEMALIGSPMTRATVFTAQYKDVLTKLECSYSYDNNLWALNLKLNSDEVQQPNHLTLRYAQDTQKFELINMKPEPVRLQEIQDFLNESNDMPGLLNFWRRSCIQRV